MIKTIKKIIISFTPPIIIKWYKSIKQAILAKKNYTKFNFNSRKPIIILAKNTNDFPLIDLLRKFNIDYVISSKAKKRRINFVYRNCDILELNKNCLFFSFENLNNNFVKENLSCFTNSLLICCNSFSSLKTCSSFALHNIIYMPNKPEKDDFNSCFISKEKKKEYYFLRLMLYLEVINFADFCECTKNYLSIKSNKICMSLPESINRRNVFKSINKYDNYIFYPCILNRIGWLGCALSYKLVALQCQNLNYSHFIICEDDAIFKNDYYTNVENIFDFACKHDIDLINTYPTWTDNNINVKNNYAYKINDVYIAKRRCTTGAVLNIYSKRFLKMISNYKIVNTRFRYAKYQMDQYTKSNSMKFNVFVTSPSLIDHNMELYSTINKKQNSELDYNYCASSQEVYLRYLINKKYEIKK